MRGVLPTIISAMLLGALASITFFALCLAIAMLGGGSLGFWIFTAPASALSPFFSFLTGLLPDSFVHALVGKSSVGSSFGLLAFWSMLLWFMLFWFVALVIFRRHQRARLCDSDKSQQNC